MRPWKNLLKDWPVILTSRYGLTLFICRRNWRHKPIWIQAYHRIEFFLGLRIRKEIRHMTSAQAKQLMWIEFQTYLKPNFKRMSGLNRLREIQWWFLFWRWIFMWRINYIIHYQKLLFRSEDHSWTGWKDLKNKTIEFDPFFYIQKVSTALKNDKQKNCSKFHIFDNFSNIFMNSRFSLSK